jgi:hypothetical protein
MATESQPNVGNSDSTQVRKRNKASSRNERGSNMKKSMFSGFVLAFLMMLGVASQANAQSVSCGGSGGSQDTIDLSSDGDCSISGSITATTGYIRIISGGNLTISGDVLASNHSNIMLEAQGDISVIGSVTVDNGSAPANGNGQILIRAHQGGGSTNFVVGASGSNGVSGNLVTAGVSGGGPDTALCHGGVTISNGGSGGITVTSMSNFSVQNTSSRSGYIGLDASAGNITLPSGTLSSDGTGDNSACGITLLANEINTSGGTVISASDNDTSHLGHGILIAAAQITYSSGLGIHADGGGDPTLTAANTIVPAGGAQITDNGDPTELLVLSSLVNGSFGTSGQLLFTGDGTLNITANAPNTGNTGVFMSGYPLTFEGDDLNIQSKGSFANSHNITLEFDGDTSSGINGLNFDGGAVTLDASGPDSGAGDAGFVLLNIDTPVCSSSTTCLLKANGAPAGSGRGGNVTVDPGNNASVTLGQSNGQFALAAKGGNTGGDGGAINVNASNGDVTLVGAQTPPTTPLDVSTSSMGSGNGGTITLNGNNFNVTDGTAEALIANGTGTGNGGSISLSFSGPVTIGSSASNVSISAASLGTGNGGNLSIPNIGAVTISGASVSVAAGSSGDGNGGNIVATSSNDGITVTGFLSATAEGAGTGGTISLDANTLTIDSAFLLADAGATGNANDDAISLTVEGSSNNFDASGAFVSARGQSGDGGNITINVGGDITLESSTQIVANSVTSGRGGEINVTSGGNFSLNTSSEIFSSAASGGGDGGDITVNAAGNITVNDTTQIVSNAGTTAVGGNITLAAGQSINNTTVTVGGAVMSQSGPSGGVGGDILLSYQGTGGLAPVNIQNTANVNVDAITVGALAGQLTIQNTNASAPLAVTIDGLISAIVPQSGGGNNAGGDTVLEQPGQNVVVNGGGSIASLITSLGDNISITTGTSNIAVESIVTTTGDVTLTANGGSIFAPDALITAPAISAPTLIASASQSIGLLTEPLYTAIDNLTLSTTGAVTDPDTDGIVNVVNITTDDVAIEDGSGAPNNFSLVNTLSSNTTVGSITGGFISIGANVGTLTVNGGATLSVTPGTGSILLSMTSSSGVISLGASSTLSASAGGSSDITLGNVQLEVGTPSSTGLCSASSTFTFTDSAPTCGPNQLTANSPVNTATVDLRGMLLYGPNVSSIVLGGNVQLTASH